MVKMSLSPLHILLFLSCVHYAYSQVLFHCRTPGETGCLNGGTCDRQTGTCTCQDGFEGYNCGLETAKICAEGVDNPCGKNGKCYDESLCFCDYAYIGTTCATPKVYTECMGTGLLMQVSVPAAFRGEISVKQNNTEVSNDDITNHVALPECTFKEEASDIDGYKKLVYTLNLDGSSDCVNASLIQHDNRPDKDDITYETSAVQTFSTKFVTKYDRFLTFFCTHKASNFTMFAKLDAVKLDEKDNLIKKETDKTYSPVRFSVNDDTGAPLSKALYVGDAFTLLFYLMDDSVYKALRIEVCTANDTSGQTPVVFQFMDEGCPTVEGEAIMQDIYGQHLIKHTLDTGEVPAAKLDLLAFKFKRGPNVGFNCKVKICKQGDELACQPGCGRPGETPEVPNGGTIVEGGAAGDVSIGSGGSAAAADAAAADAAAADAGAAAADAGAADAGAADAGAADAGATDAGAADAGAADAGAADAPVRRRRRSSGTQLEETFSAIVQVIDPQVESGSDIVIGKRKPVSDEQEKPKSNTAEDCFRSQEILIVIIVMSALVLMLLIACFILSVTIIRTRNKVFKYHDDSGSSSPRFFIPRAKVQA